jgi:hypothetical protein
MNTAIDTSVSGLLNMQFADLRDVACAHVDVHEVLLSF